MSGLWDFRARCVAVSGQSSPRSPPPGHRPRGRRLTPAQGRPPRACERRALRWAPVTTDSASDNLRPTVAAGHGRWALVWLRGRYDGFVDDYDQQVVAVVRPGG